MIIQIMRKTKFEFLSVDPVQKWRENSNIIILGLKTNRLRKSQLPTNQQDQTMKDFTVNLFYFLYDVKKLEDEFSLLKYLREEILM